MRFRCGSGYLEMEKCGEDQCKEDNDLDARNKAAIVSMRPVESKLVELEFEKPREGNESTTQSDIETTTEVPIFVFTEKRKSSTAEVPNDLREDETSTESSEDRPSKVLLSFIGRKFEDTTTESSSVFANDTTMNPRLFAPKASKVNVDPHRFISREAGKLEPIDNNSPGKRSDKKSILSPSNKDNDASNGSSRGVKSSSSSSMMIYRFKLGGGGSKRVDTSPELLPRPLTNSFMEAEGDPCKWTQWGEWSLCTVSCGRGFRYLFVC